MAEAVGIVASSIQIGGLIVTIAKAGLQIQTLYHEIQDASDEVAFRLQELRILSGILQASESISPKAESLCELCLSELHIVLAELQSQIYQSRGIKRIVASAKVIVKKDVMQKLESRLGRSVQFLMLANQIRMSSIQSLVLRNQNTMSSTQALILRNQDAMLGLLKTHPNQFQMLEQAVSTSTLEGDHTKHRSVATISPHTDSHNRCSSMCVEDASVWRLAWPSTQKPKTSWTLGLPCATGAIQFERLAIHDGNSKLSASCTTTEDTVACPPPVVRVKVVLPRWLSYKALDVIAWKAQIGWKQYLRVKNIFPAPNFEDGWSTPFNVARRVIYSGSLNELRSQFENRELTPWDEDSSGKTLLTYAVSRSRWDICNYLMDLGQNMPHRSATSEMPIIDKHEYQLGVYPQYPSKLHVTSSRVDVVHSCRKFLGRVDEDDLLIYCLLSNYDGSIDEFLSLRRSVWPDSQFYRPDFSPQRMLIAVGIVGDWGGTWRAAPMMCRSVLGLDNGTAQNNMHFQMCTDWGLNLFHGLAMKVGRTHGTDIAGEWHTLIRDVLRHLTDITVLSNRGFIEFVVEGAHVTMTPLSILISEGVQARLRGFPQHATIRSTESAAVVAGCEKAIFAWLLDLSEGGIDLELYGENEKEHFRHQEVFRWEGYPMNGMTYDYWDYWDWTTDEPSYRHLYNVRLINFHYGRFPTDWKFWWSEPSDEFAGHFWSLIESRNQGAVLSVPGAWVD